MILLSFCITLSPLIVSFDQSRMSPPGKFTVESSWKKDLSSYRKKKQIRIPNSMDQLFTDQCIILGLLREIYNLGDHEVENVELKLLSPCSDIRGNLSNSERVRILVKTKDGHEHCYNWFVKLQPRNSKNTGLVSNFNPFRNEIEFYSKIAPELKNFIKSFNNSNEEIEFDIPKMLFSEEHDDHAIIILEDLVSEGYKQERDENGNCFLSKEKAILAVESIAKIHAASYALQSSQKIDLAMNHPTLGKSALLWTNAEMTARLFAVKDIYCSFLRESKKPDSPLLLERFNKTFDSEELLRKKCFERSYSDEEGILCLQQGDFHYNNLLFKESEGKMKVMIVDWQLIYNGRSGADISYLLMSSMDPELFEVEEENIKARYFHSFNQTISALQHQHIDSMESEDNDINVDKKLEMEYDRSLQLGFFLSCGNVMNKENYKDKDHKVSFTYHLCREAACRNLI